MQDRAGPQGRSRSYWPSRDWQRTAAISGPIRAAGITHHGSRPVSSNPHRELACFRATTRPERSTSRRLLMGTAQPPASPSEPWRRAQPSTTSTSTWASGRSTTGGSRNGSSAATSGRNSRASRAWPLLDGAGNDDNVLELPAGTYRAVSVRSFDPWSDVVDLVARRSPLGQLDLVDGRFKDWIGTFIADDILDGSRSSSGSSGRTSPTGVSLGAVVLARRQRDKRSTGSWSPAGSADPRRQANGSMSSAS